jgi:hypothetical protein
VSERGPVPAAIAHESPGRLRLKIPDRRRDYDFFAGLADEIMGFNGIDEVRANPLTAGVLILHGRTDGHEIARALEDAGRIELVDPAYALQASGAADQISLRTLLLGCLLLLGVVQLLRGQALAPAVTLFWMAAELLRSGGMQPDGGASS